MPEPIQLTPDQQKLYDELKLVRTRTDVKLPPSPILRQEIVGLDGTLQPFTFRYYQVQGIYHMLRLKRMLLGDGTGLGKTAQAIGTLCYLWEKRPETKVIVVAPKSAIRQWAEEIERFTKGVKVYIATAPKDKGESPVEARQRIYEAWAAAPSGPNDPKAVLILNYALLVRDWNHGGFQPLKPNGQPDPKAPVLPGLLDGTTKDIAENLTVIFDECFDYYTPITLADGSTEIIGKIVCGEMPVEVLTWNFDQNRLEPRKIARWIKNPLLGGRGPKKSLLKLEFKYANSCRVTKSHKFYTVSGGTVQARDLKIGSSTAFLNLLAPTQDQLQIVLGGLLGDASLSHPTRANWGVSFVQGEAQTRYLDFKREALKSLGVSEIDTTPSGYGGRDIHRFRVDSNPSLCAKFDLHDGKRKRVTLEWLDAIGPLGLAIWYGDDGSIQRHLCQNGEYTQRVTLNTQGFTREENYLLAGWLRWKWGVHAEVKPTRKGYLLYLNDAASTVFLGILPGSFPSIEYKFPGKIPIELSALDVVAKPALVRDAVVSVQPWKSLPKNGRPHAEYVYDLEVEGNHNYFAGGTLVSNCTAFKSMRTKTWEVARFLSDRSNRVYALTATLLKNNLMEGYCIYKAILPSLFGPKTKFMEDYTFFELKSVGKAKIPVIKGYKNLDHFKAKIDLYFLGRPKHVVSNELPTLTTKEVSFELNEAETTKYREALSGVLELGNGEIREFEDTKALTSLIYCQQVVNSLSLLKFKEGDEIGGFNLDLKSPKIGTLCSKEQALLDLLTEELEDDKVIVYTRFASLVGRLQEILKKSGIKSVRITGAENDKDRQKAKVAFQDLKSDVRVIFITNAGSEAINLQAAAGMIFFDQPWSWGDYVQILGRMIRIGSPHKGVLAYHLLAELPEVAKKDRKTIDHHVLGMLRKKKNLIDKVLGEAAIGALEFQSEATSLKDLVRAMQGAA